mgnify:CR=1 FL=1
MLKSFKKKLAIRKYRERDQPEWRKNKGFLEKHVDYKKRADHYNQKKSQLNKLREKSQLKNEDEFYFKMVNSKVTQFGDVEMKDLTQNRSLEDVQRIVKTNSANLLKLQYMRIKNRVERLKSELQFTDLAAKKKVIEFDYEDTPMIKKIDSTDNKPQKNKSKINSRSVTIKKKEDENEEKDKEDLFFDESHANEIGKKNKEQYLELMGLMTKLRTLKDNLLQLDEEKAFLNPKERKITKIKNGKTIKKVKKKKKR